MLRSASSFCSNCLCSGCVCEHPVSVWGVPIPCVICLYDVLCFHQSRLKVLWFLSYSAPFSPPPSVLWAKNPMNCFQSQSLSLQDDPSFRQLVKGMNRWNTDHLRTKINAVCESRIVHRCVCKPANNFLKGWLCTVVLLNPCLRIPSWLSAHVKKEVPICC